MLLLSHDLPRLCNTLRSCTQYKKKVAKEISSLLMFQCTQRVLKVQMPVEFELMRQQRQAWVTASSCPILASRTCPEEFRAYHDRCPNIKYFEIMQRWLLSRRICTAMAKWTWLLFSEVRGSTGARANHFQLPQRTTHQWLAGAHSTLTAFIKLT